MTIALCIISVLHQGYNRYVELSAQFCTEGLRRRMELPQAVGAATQGVFHRHSRHTAAGGGVQCSAALKWSPTTPRMISMSDMIFNVLIGSFIHKTPTVAISAVPSPDHTA